MRVGSIVFSTEQGIGILAKDFYDNGVVDNVVVLAHGRRQDHPEWYPSSKFLSNAMELNWNHENGLIRQFIDNIDVLLCFETPFNWPLLEYCRNEGVKTALMVMFECMPKSLPVEPDLILCPSLLDLNYYPLGKFIPVPVNKPWKYRERATTFVHNAGHGGLKGRNGTQELITAWQYVKTPVTLIIRSQDCGYNAEIRNAAGGRMLMEYGSIPSDQLYAEGDVFIFPEKFNGLSLPLQEAYASGMLVMSTNRYPMNFWLPNEPLIPIAGWCSNEVSPRCNRFDEAVITPEAIAKTIDNWYGKFIGDFSIRGREWAIQHSWNVLKPLYMKALEELL